MDEQIMQHARGAFEEDVVTETAEAGAWHEVHAAGRGNEVTGEHVEPQEEVKPDPYDSDDELRPVGPADMEDLDGYPREMPGQFGAGADGFDAGGMRYRAGHVRAGDAHFAPTPEADDGEEGDDEDVPAEDERQCRICFSGREEEETMGRLISPCLCTGSMRVCFFSCK